MGTENLEFNVIKTLGTINKDDLLKTIYQNKFGAYNYVKLNDLANTNKLADDTLTFLKDLFDGIIAKKDDLVDKYKKIQLNKKHPRRYGKRQIEEDVKRQDGVPTELQTTMLNLAKLRAITINLLAKGTSDHYKGTKNFSSEDLKLINSMVRDIDNKGKKILKKRLKILKQN